MRFENRDTEVFMYLLRDFVTDKNTYLLRVGEFYKNDPTKTLLGYYDDNYIYIIPSVVVGLRNQDIYSIG